MQIWLDTADIEEIRRAAPWGVVSGVTTNPSLLAKAGAADFRRTVEEICSLIRGPVSAEVLNLDSARSIMEEARRLASWAPNVVVKIPITPAGLEAISILSKEGIKINMTLCFSANQALLGALAGATYVSPFVGRLDDAGHDGMQVVADAVEIFQRHNLPTQVVAASIRHPLHCVVAAKAGAPIATIPYKVLTQMMEHPLTEVGIARFAKDWAGLSSLPAGRKG